MRIISQFFYKRLRELILVLLVLSLAACASVHPKPGHDVCQIFKKNPEWYWASKGAAKRWGTPVHVQMAIMYHESAFDATARPPRKMLLGFIPWKRPSTAYGYSQALNGTWDHYKNSSGRHWVRRDDFSHATDFIGWYTEQVHNQAGVPKWDAYKLYLAYHEGIGGYQKKSYLSKQWLMKVANRVKTRSLVYHKQLQQCEAKLPQKPWYYLW